MNTSRIDTRSGPSRIVRVLAEAEGEWVTARDLTRRTNVLALSTRISEARRWLLPEKADIEYGRYRDNVGNMHGRYRLIGEWRAVWRRITEAA